MLPHGVGVGRREQCVALLLLSLQHLRSVEDIYYKPLQTCSVPCEEVRVCVCLCTHMHAVCV